MSKKLKVKFINLKIVYAIFSLVALTVALVTYSRNKLQ